MSLRGLLRRVFTLGRGLSVGMPEDALGRDPVELFGDWFEAAAQASLAEPTAMTLATCTRDARPSARMVLLKSFDQRGFVFFTNYGSRKARELEENPRAALVFYWQPLLRQVRVEGTVERVGTAASRAYFASRPRGSRIGAWASRQSEVLDSRAHLAARVRRIERQFSGAEVPLPEFWGGYRVIPQRIEFWQGRASRLHDRACFERDGAGWRSYWMYP